MPPAGDDDFQRVHQEATAIMTLAETERIVEAYLLSGHHTDRAYLPSKQSLISLAYFSLIALRFTFCVAVTRP